MESSGGRSGGQSQRSRGDNESKCPQHGGSEYLAYLASGGGGRGGAKGLDHWFRAVGDGGDQEEDTVAVRQGLWRKETE